MPHGKILGEPPVKVVLARGMANRVNGVLASRTASRGGKLAPPVWWNVRYFHHRGAEARRFGRNETPKPLNCCCSPCLGASVPRCLGASVVNFRSNVTNPALSDEKDHRDKPGNARPSSPSGAVRPSTLARHGHHPPLDKTIASSVRLFRRAGPGAIWPDGHRDEKPRVSTSRSRNRHRPGLPPQ
jgi:hypothetical protein